MLDGDTMRALASFALGAFVLVASSAGCGWKIIDFGDAPLIDFGKDCMTDADCADYEPFLALFNDKTCNPPYCDENKRCNTRPLDRSLPDDVDGDCHRPACVKGQRLSRVDDLDAPSLGECVVPACQGGVNASYDRPDRTPCAAGLCQNGQCVAGPRDGGTDAEAADAADDATTDGEAPDGG